METAQFTVYSKVKLPARGYQLPCSGSQRIKGGQFGVYMFMEARLGADRGLIRKIHSIHVIKTIF